MTRQQIIKMTSKTGSLVATKPVWLQLIKSTSLGLQRSRLLRPCRKKKVHLCERKDDWRRSAIVVLNRKPPGFTGGLSFAI